MKLADVKPNLCRAASHRGRARQADCQLGPGLPEAARGTQEGHFPYDFGPTSTMTNANIDAV